MAKRDGSQYTECEDIDKVSAADQQWFASHDGMSWRIRPPHPIEWKSGEYTYFWCSRSNCTKCSGCNMLVISSPSGAIRVRYLFHGDMYSNPLKTCPWLLEAMQAGTDDQWVEVVERYLAVDTG